MPAREGLTARVAENIRVQAAIRGWNQSDLARAVGMNQRTVNERWWGGRQWQLEDLERVSRALGVDPADLLRARRDSNPQPSDVESQGSTRARVYSFAAAWLARNEGAPARRLVVAR